VFGPCVVLIDAAKRIVSTLAVDDINLKFQQAIFAICWSLWLRTDQKQGMIADHETAISSDNSPGRKKVTEISSGRNHRRDDVSVLRAVSAFDYHRQCGLRVENAWRRRRTADRCSGFDARRSKLSYSRAHRPRDRISKRTSWLRSYRAGTEDLARRLYSNMVCL
jgi:hypothetical protein